MTTVTPEGSAHHQYGPSTLKPRSICPGWTPDKTGPKDKADEGQLMHAAAETENYTGLTPEQASCVKSVLDDVAVLEKDADIVHKEIRLSILDGLTFGTADRVIVKKATGGWFADVVDFKFGRWSVDDAEFNLQGWAYALGVFDLYPEVTSVTVRFLSPRRDEKTSYIFTRVADYDRMALAVKTVIEDAKRYDDTYDESMLRPNRSNCLYCGRIKAGTCPKVRQFAITTAKRYEPIELADDELHSSMVTDSVKMAKMLDTARVLEKMVDSIKAHALTLALEQGGALWDDKGNPIFEVSERDGNRDISDLGLALPVLSKHLDDRDLLSVAKVSLSGALKLIAAKAPRGQKAKVIGEIEAALEEAGALTRGTGYRYLRRVKT